MARPGGIYRPSSFNRYPYHIGKMAISMHRSRMIALDHRLKMSDDSMPALVRELSPADINNLFKHLSILLLSARDVEKNIKSEWGIPRTVKKIEVLICGNFNNMIADTGSIHVLIGNPDEYDSFFVSPAPLYAHEVAHTLLMHDNKGKFSWNAGMPAIECFNILKSELSPDGTLKRKYFEDIPYNIMPKELLFPEKAARNSLMYYANELIADKVSLQVCGEKEAGIHVKRKLENGIRSSHLLTKDAWQGFFLTALAREFKLGHEENIMRQRLDGIECPWISSISTEDLLNKASVFFNKVSLKHQ